MGTNRLAEATSPYLLQHAHNPVDWYPWGTEALERARREGKPIFLSIGYAACHWCHVMEREVFEKPAIAALMNEHFVNIKVDREERPDLDDLYMLATQIMSGSGGWPMSVWLTPELEPFYAGTYFPPEDAHGRPGFVRLEKALAEAWATRRAALLEQARQVVEAVRTHADEGGAEAGQQEIDLGQWLSTATEQYADRFDGVNGGLGGAPKFPPHQALGLWLEMLARAEALGLAHANREMLRNMVVRTLDGMMRGGIYDHVGGGFARYSTDERWLVPHFEKMLYDSAQLAPVYARAAVVLGRGDYGRVARETLDFWMREMMDERGGFYSSLDADSEGAEGKYYVWTLAQVREVLGNADAAVVIDYFGLTEDGNWAESPVEGASVPAPALSLEALAQKYEMPPEKMGQRLMGLLEKMRVSRARRAGPGLDDKVLTGWNGLMVSALAVCGRLLGEASYVAAAVRTAEFLWREHRKEGRLLRVSRQAAGGGAHTEAFLDDHAYLLAGLVDLIEALPSAEAALWEGRAKELAGRLVEDFGDAKRGGFFFTGPRHERLFAQMKNAADNAAPSGNGVAIRALLRLAQRTGEGPWEEAALGAVRAFAVNIARRPEYFATILQGLLERAEGGAGRGAGGAAESSQVMDATAEASAVGADRTFDVVVRLRIAEAYHVQGHEPPGRQLQGTVARLRGTAELEAQEWMYPAAEPVEGGQGYAGSVELRARCRLAAGVVVGRHVMRAIVEAQPCTATACLAAQTVAAEFVVEVR